jgi:hypothetical protein
MAATIPRRGVFAKSPPAACFREPATQKSEAAMLKSRSQETGHSPNTKTPQDRECSYPALTWPSQSVHHLDGPLWMTVLQGISQSSHSIQATDQDASTETCIPQSRLAQIQGNRRRLHVLKDIDANLRPSLPTLSMYVGIPSRLQHTRR